MDDEELVFNGVDGATGGYLHRPTSLAALAEVIRGDTFPGDAVPELRYRRREPDFGTVYGVDPEDLAAAGWGLVAAEDVPAEVLDALAPLRRLRADQAGEHYREFVGSGGVRPGDSKRTFLRRHGMASALPADPERVPYYLLLIGGPDSISFRFQYQLDVQYAVGRIAFDTVEEYRRYAEAVVARDRENGPRTVRLFGPRHPADRATQLSSRLIASLSESLRTYDARTTSADAATKGALLDLLRADTGVLFTASHGIGFPRGDARQRDTQGALVCQDWPGPLLGGEVSGDCYLGGADVDRLAGAGSRLVLSFACYGAGTPHQDDFARDRGVPAPAITERPFVARLPQRLLAHPGGGPLAFVGHVDRAWACSFGGRREGIQDGVFRSVLSALLDGRRVGSAMEFFDDRYAALTAELHDYLDGGYLSGEAADDRWLAALWLENNDARSYTVLGDPAVRLCQP